MFDTRLVLATVDHALAEGTLVATKNKAMEATSVAATNIFRLFFGMLCIFSSNNLSCISRI